MKTAVVFAGQGAQFVGMGRDLADAFPACRALFERADAVLGRPLARICFEGPEDELTRSDNCQPAIFVVGLACYTAWREVRGGPEPDVMAGLSLGEWTALHAAGALDFDTTLRVLEARGRFMQEACAAARGGMISLLGLALPAAEAVAKEAGVHVANINSAQQIVLSGAADAIARVEPLALAAGAKRAVVLNVAGAFHSPLMSPAADKLADTVAALAFREPRPAVLSNVTGKPHADATTIGAAMLRQIDHPVRWLDDVAWMADHGVTHVVECGPGKVLTGLIKRIAHDMAVANVQGAADLEKGA